MNKGKSNTNTLLLILLMILIVAILGLGGYFVWKLESKSDNNDNQTSSANATITNVSNNQTTEKKEEQINEPTPEPEPEPVETKEDYVKSCTLYSYKEIARNPNSYKGKRARITGEVIQVQQEGNEVVLRINMTKNEYGYYEDTIMAGYAYADENEDRILEGDIITIYGELYGTITYTSVLGADITVPAIKTMYLDIPK